MASKDMFATDYGMSYTFFNSPLRLTSESASSHTVPAGIFVPPASPTVRRDTVRQGLVVRIREGLWSESERACGQNQRGLLWSESKEGLCPES